MADARRYLYGWGIALENEVSLRDDLRIRPIKLNDDVEWLKTKARTQYEYGMLCAFAGGINFELELKADDDKEAAIGIWNAQWDLILLSILRGAPVTWLFESVTPHNQSPDRHTRVLGHASRGGPWSKSVPFSSAEFTSYRDLEQRFHTMLQEDRFVHAASVAALSYSEPKPSIQMAAVWSGIEALLGFDHELRFRIALAVARILETDSSARSFRFGDVKKLYDLRSKSVHGANIKPELLRDGLDRSLKLLCELVLAFVRKGSLLAAAEADLLFLQN